MKIGVISLYGEKMSAAVINSYFTYEKSVEIKMYLAEDQLQLDENFLNRAIVFDGFQLLADSSEIPGELKERFYFLLAEYTAQLAENTGLEGVVVVLPDNTGEKMFMLLNLELAGRKVNSIIFRKSAVPGMIAFSESKEQRSKNFSVLSGYPAESIKLDSNIAEYFFRDKKYLSIENTTKLGYIIPNNSSFPNRKFIEIIGANTTLPHSADLSITVDGTQDNLLVLVAEAQDKYYEVWRRNFESPEIGQDEYLININFKETWHGNLNILRNNQLIDSIPFSYPFPVLTT